MANSAPPLRYPQIWWGAMMARAGETGRPLPEVVQEFRSLMNSPMPAISWHDAVTMSLEYPSDPEYIYRAFQVPGE